MDLGLEGRRLDQAPPALADPLDAALGSNRRRRRACALIRLLRPHGQPGRDRGCRRIWLATRTSRRAERIAMIELLGQLGRAEDRLAACWALLERGLEPSRSSLPRSPPSGEFQDASVGRAVARVATDPPRRPCRDRILGLLASRPAWARALVDALGSGEIAATRPDAGPRPARSPRSSDPALLEPARSRSGAKLPRAGLARKEAADRRDPRPVARRRQGQRRPRQADLQGELCRLPQALRRGRERSGRS